MRPVPLLAGMPTLTLSDVGPLRLEAISFFLVGLLLSAAVVMAIWNSLRRDFVWLPRLSYGKACGVVVLWGLLFIVVLTIISGARELMTPGAWEKVGYTYKLRPEAKHAESSGQPDLLAKRREKLQALWEPLRRYVERHEGRFPATRDELHEIHEAAWEVPTLAGTTYVYLGGSLADSERPIAYEPEVFDSSLALFASGEVRPVTMAELRQADRR